MVNEKELDLLNIFVNIPIFRGLSNDDLKKIIPLLREKTYEAGTLIIQEGARGNSMYIIKKGTVKICKIGETGAEVDLGNLYSGAFFGELSLIDNLPRSANVTALEDAETFQLKKVDFDRLLAENVNIANLFYQNCLLEIFSRFRHVTSNFTFSQNFLKEKSEQLDEINKDLSSAQKVQSFFINSDFMDGDADSGLPLKHSYIYNPCIAIGGDFLNIVKLRKNLIGMIIADFEGHGITASLGTGVLKSAYSIAMEKLGDKPVKLMKFLNDHFIEVIHSLYATCYYALINTEKKSITLAKAGHHHPFFWKKRLQGFVKIECVGTGLGLLREAKFGKVTFSYEPGDKILFFTDGIIEQIDGRKDMYSKKRLQRLFRDLILSEEPHILNRIFQDLKEFAGDVPFEDDITLSLFEF